MFALLREEPVNCSTASAAASPLQIAWRYSCLYFYERSYESYGKLFDKVSDLMVS